MTIEMETKAIAPDWKWQETGLTGEKLRASFVELLHTACTAHEQGKINDFRFETALLTLRCMMRGLQ